MKQKLFLGCLAALAMTSCSNDDAIETNYGNAIGFRSAMATRATETDNGNLTSFFVTALNGDGIYFSNLEFTKGEDNFFTSAEKYYYPGDKTPLQFYAYAPSATAMGATLNISGTEKKMTGFSPKSDISQQVDFITASAEGDCYNNGATGVELEFSHRLAQIEVKCKSANPSYDFEVKGVRLAQIGSMGDFSFIDNTWTLTEGHLASYEKTLDTPVKLTADAVSLMEGDNAMLIPQQLTAWDTSEQENNSNGAYIAVLVKITTKAGSRVYPFPSDTGNTTGYAWAAIPVGTLWKAGNKYVYTLDFSTGAGYADPTESYMPGIIILNGAIKFTVNVNAWTDAALDNTEMPAEEGVDMNPDDNDFNDPFA